MKREQLIRFIQEDIGNFCDITSESTIPNDHQSSFKIVSKEKNSVIICGLEIAKEILDIIEFSGIIFSLKDGDCIENGGLIMEGNGSTKSILLAERVMLNIIQHLSGISTQVSEIIRILDNKKIQIFDTRKTLPGLRELQKYAVRIGGGTNHRDSLSSMILIKNNHIKVCGSATKALELVNKRMPRIIEIEIECGTVDEVREVCDFTGRVDMIMLDNMSITDIKKSSEIIRLHNKEILIEVSGNITKGNIHLYRELDIDRISIGSLTHSVTAVDISLRVG